VNIIFISAGEVSGDKHTSILCQNILKLKNDIEIYGFVSLQSQKIGVKNLNDVSLKSGVGLIENIPASYEAIKSYKKAKDFFKNNKVNLLILVDNQGFNLKLAKLAKKFEIPVIYYIGPQEWIWGFKNGTHKIMQNIDRLYTIFKNEFNFYNQYPEYSDKLRYLGHPLLSDLKIYCQKDIKSELNFSDKKVIALMPGSRKQEIDNLMNLFIEVYKSINHQYNFLFIIPNIWESYIKENFNVENIKVVFGSSEYYMQSSDLIIAASGTVTLEAVVYNIPVIPCYKLNKLSYLIAKQLIKIDYISLPNIVANKKVINELIQDKLNLENILKEIEYILSNEDVYHKIKSDFKEIKKDLEPFNSVDKTAKEIIRDYLKS